MALPPEDQAALGMIEGGLTLGQLAAMGWIYNPTAGTLYNVYTGVLKKYTGNGQWTVVDLGGGDDLNGDGDGNGGGGFSLGNQYQHLADLYGVTLSSGQINSLIQGQVSADEFHQRLQVIQRLKDNKTFLDQFGEEVKAEKLGQFTFKDRVDFVLGKSPSQFYNLWNITAARTAATEGGLTVGTGEGDLGVTRKRLASILGDLGLTGPEGAGQAEAALTQVIGGYTALSHLLAFARDRGYTVTEREIYRYAEGKSSLESKNKIERLQQELAFAGQPTATPRFQAGTRGGLAGTSY